MSSEKEILRQKYQREEEEGEQKTAFISKNSLLPEAPPAYDDIQPQQKPYTSSSSQSQFQSEWQALPHSNNFGYPGVQQQNQGYSYPSGPSSPFAQSQSQLQSQAPQAPQVPSSQENEPNVYKIKPDLANINYAPLQHLNPQYEEFRQNQQAKMAKGERNYMDPNYKAPINKGHVGKKKIDLSFPGRSGATYHNAANNH